MTKKIQTFKEFHKFCKDTAQVHGDETLVYAALGLTGEAGEVAELVKKGLRARTKPDRAKVGLELADVLWYVARCAQAVGLDLQNVVDLGVMKMSRRERVGKDHAGELDDAKKLLRIRRIRFGYLLCGHRPVDECDCRVAG